MGRRAGSGGAGRAGAGGGAGEAAPGAGGRAAAPAPCPERAYHHGDLRSALITAAEALLVAQGRWNFTLREVARAAGVSHNAPYNHFADRRALLAAVAARGFAALTAALHAEVAGAGPDPAARIRASARAYVAFAAAEPARFRLMFGPELAAPEGPDPRALLPEATARDTSARDTSAPEDADLRRAGEAAFGVLAGLIAEGVAAGRLGPDAGGGHALAAWALVHGLAVLLVDGRLPRPPDPAGLAALADDAARALLDGLAHRDDPPPPARLGKPAPMG